MSPKDWEGGSEGVVYDASRWWGRKLHGRLGKLEQRALCVHRRLILPHAVIVQMKCDHRSRRPKIWRYKMTSHGVVCW